VSRQTPAKGSELSLWSRGA